MAPNVKARNHLRSHSALYLTEEEMRAHSGAIIGPASQEEQAKDRIRTWLNTEQFDTVTHPSGNNFLSGNKCAGLVITDFRKRGYISLREWNVLYSGRGRTYGKM